MNIDDFKAAMALLFMRRLGWSDWDAANMMKQKAALIERAFHEGDSPLDGVGRCIGRNLEEEYVSPEDAMKIKIANGTLQA